MPALEMHAENHEKVGHNKKLSELIKNKIYDKPGVFQAELPCVAQHGCTADSFWTHNMHAFCVLPRPRHQQMLPQTPQLRAEAVTRYGLWVAKFALYVRSFLTSYFPTVISCIQGSNFCAFVLHCKNVSFLNTDCLRASLTLKKKLVNFVLGWRKNFQEILKWP